MDTASGRSVAAPIVAGKGRGLRLLYQEHPQGQDTIINRCLPQDASMQAEGQYRLDVLGEFTGRVSHRRSAPYLAWNAELERSSRQGWTHQRHLRAKLARDTDHVQLEWEAWQRRYALLLGGFVEESAVLRLSAQSAPDAELSASVDVGRTRLTGTVRTDLHQGSLLELKTGPSAKSGGPATSSFSVGAKTGGPATSSFSVGAKSGGPATSTIPLSASSGYSSIPITHRASSAAQSAAGDATIPGCTDGTRSDSTAAKGLAAEQNETVSARFRGEESLNNRLCSLSANGRAQKVDGKSRDQEADGRGGKEDKRVGERVTTLLQRLRTYVAFPFGARSGGGWRLELRQRLGSSLHVDARIKGGQVKLREGDLLEGGGVNSPSSPSPDASSANFPAGPRGALQGFLRLALRREGTPWSTSLALGSKSAGPAVTCRWRKQGGQQEQQVLPHQRATSASTEGNAMWHSWHLNRLEVAAKEGGECWTEPWLEAKAVLRGWGHRVASAQAKLSLPL